MVTEAAPVVTEAAPVTVIHHVVHHVVEHVVQQVPVVEQQVPLVEQQVPMVEQQVPVVETTDAAAYDCDAGRGIPAMRSYDKLYDYAFHPTWLLTITKLNLTVLSYTRPL